MKRAVLLLLAASIAAIPALAVAQGPTNDSDDFNLRINGDYTVPAGETIGSLVVIRGDVRVDGRVDDVLFVIDGDVTVSGSVGGDITVFDGDVTVATGGTVEDVTLIRGDIHEEPGSQVTGDVNKRSRFFSRGAAVLFGLLLWLGATVLLLVSGIVFALIGRRQLMGSAALMTERPGATILTAFLTILAIPALAVAAIVTVVGIPAAIVLVLFLIPALALLGYVVAGTMLGRLILGGFRNREPGSVHAVGAAVLGVLILQLAWIIPFLGFVSFLLALWGTGALVFFAIRAARRPAPPSEPQPEPTPPPPTTEPAG